MDKQILFTLLQKIHYYYPIGFPDMNDIYPGYQELQRIIKKKVNHLIEHKVIEPWNTLVQSLARQIKHDFMLDQAYHQFPNLLLSMDLSKSEMDDIGQKKTLYLCLSLLTEHFTIFIEENFKFLKFPLKKNEKFTITPFTQLLYGEEYCKPPDIEYFKLIKNTVKEFYPDYNFIPHSILMNYKITGGTPHGELNEYQNAYPIYAFLFVLSSHYLEKSYILGDLLKLADWKIEPPRKT